MNYKAIALIVAVAVGSIGPANGQLLKKLGKKAEKAAERTILNRTDREVSKGTDKAIDEALGAGKKNEKEKDKDATKKKDGTTAKKQPMLPSFLGGSMEDVPDTYAFSYRATMKIIDENDKEETNVRYWLEPDAAYFGTEVLAEGAAGQIAVMDMDIEGMVMFMDNGDQKTAMRLSGDNQLMDKYLKKAAAEEEVEDMQLTPIEGKTILGYRCKGFQMETDDGISRIWVTDEAPVGMVSGMMKADYVPKGMPDLGGEALFMEMEYTPKKGKEGNIRMVCTELKPVSMAIHKKEYQGIVSAAGH